MTYKELISRISESQDISKSHAKEVVDGIFEVLSSELGKGRGVSIPDLGTFSTKTKPERKVYSPHHEEHMLVPPRRVVEFSPASNMKERLKFLEPEDE